MKTLALLTLLCAVLAQAQSHDTRLMTPAQYKEFLDKVDAELPKWETALQKIDSTKSDVSYAVGKQIEQWRDLALTEVSWSRRHVAKEHVKHTVSGELKLQGSLEGAFTAMDSLAQAEVAAGLTLPDLDKYASEQGSLIDRIRNDVMARVELLEKRTCP